MKEEKRYCGGERFKSNSQIQSNFNPVYINAKDSNNPDKRLTGTNNLKLIHIKRRSAYEKYVELGESRMDLDFDMTREEFNDLIDALC